MGIHVAEAEKEEFPTIKTREKQEKGEIYWGDETGLRAGNVRSRGCAPISNYNRAQFIPSFLAPRRFLLCYFRIVPAPNRDTFIFKFSVTGIDERAIFRRRT